MINYNNSLWFSFYYFFFHLLNHLKWISQSKFMQISTKCTFENPDFKTVQLVELPPNANSNISIPLNLKMLLVISLDFLFPNIQVSSNSDMPRGNGDNFPTMCWFLDYSGERTCTDFHVALFSPQVLKLIS